MAPRQPLLVNHVARPAPLQGVFDYTARAAVAATSGPQWDGARTHADRAYVIDHRDNPSASTLVRP